MVDYKELYKQSQKENFFWDCLYNYAQSMSSWCTGWNNCWSWTLAAKVKGIWEQNKRPGSSAKGWSKKSIEVTVPVPVSLEKAKQVLVVTEKKKHFLIPESIVDAIQEIHPDVIPEGSKCTGSEVSYRLKCSPASPTAKTIIRYKYLLPTPAGDPGLTSKIIIAPLPDEVIKNCMADASLLATLIIEKYCDHLPVHRQMTHFDRTGIKLASNWHILPY